MHSYDVDFKDFFAWKFSRALPTHVSVVILMALSKMMLQCPLGQELTIAK